jgi:hypothetical protein
MGLIRDEDAVEIRKRLEVMVNPVKLSNWSKRSPRCRTNSPPKPTISCWIRRKWPSTALTKSRPR